MNKLQTYFTYSHKSLPHSLRDRLARAGDNTKYTQTTLIGVTRYEQITAQVVAAIPNSGYDKLPGGGSVNINTLVSDFIEANNGYEHNQFIIKQIPEYLKNKTMKDLIRWIRSENYYIKINPALMKRR